MCTAILTRVQPQRAVLSPPEAVQRVSRYLLDHPEEILRALKNAAGLRLGIPLDLVRWFASELKSKKAPRDVEVEAVPPGLRMTGTLQLMGTTLRGSALMFVEAVVADGDQLRVELRLGDLILRVLGESDSPVATLLKSGALDLSKPGNLIGYIPKRPAFVVSGSGDRIVLDLMKHPAITKNTKLRAAIKLITPLVTVGRIDTEADHLCIGLSPMPFGFKQTLKHVRDVLI